MSRYDQLGSHLSQFRGREHPMSFVEVERVLGGSLPPSARSHRAWWSNNEGTNVAVKAWRRAGWRTARVDMAGERVVFVRDDDCEVVRQHESTESSDAPTDHDETITLSLSALTNVAKRMLDRETDAHRGDRSKAVAELLHVGATARILTQLDRFRTTSLPGSDSVDLIREDRDAR